VEAAGVFSRLLKEMSSPEEQGLLVLPVTILVVDYQSAITDKYQSVERSSYDNVVWIRVVNLVRGVNIRHITEADS
jgi:hypothetical protein